MKSNNVISNKYLYLTVLLFVLYDLQGMLYVSGSIMSQFFILLLMFIGIICYCKTWFLKRNPQIVNVWLLFYLMLSICFVFSPKVVVGNKYEFIGTVNAFAQFKNISIFCLLFFIGYYNNLRYKINDKFLVIICVVFFVLSIFRYFYQEMMLVLEFGEDENTNNASYLFVALIPFSPFLFKKNKVIFYLFVVVSIFFIMSASKRGAIVSLFAAMIFAIFYYLRENRSSLKKYFIALIVTGLIILLVIYLYTNNDYLVERMYITETKGVGAREIAYPLLFGHWYNESNILLFLFGNGISQTVEVWGNYAHNDWLELLIDNGLIGALIYAALFIKTISFAQKYQMDTYTKLSLYLCLIVWLSQTIFSMGYTEFSNGMYTFLLGIIVGRGKKRESVIQ